MYKLKKILIFILTLMPGSLILGQEADPYLSKFFTVQEDETVYIRWTIKAGNTCNDTYVERSEDGISYSRIGIIGGICGSPDQPVTYDFTDTVPLVNRTSYYRLLLGYIGYTSPKVVEFRRYNDQGFLLAPNPFSDFTRLEFVNDDNEEHELLIIDMNGRIVQEMMTTGDEFLIRRENIVPGNYIFRLNTGGINTISGKIMAF